MYVYYLIPIVLVVAVIAYSMWMKKRVQNMDPEEAARRFHEFNAQYFDLEGDEKIVGAWSGVEFQGAKSAAGHAASAALNAASAAAVGVSKYVPNVQVGLASTGRVLVSREYSEVGQRGNFKQVMSLEAGTRAIDGATAHPGEDLGSPPKNPYNPLVSLEFVQLSSPGGETYEAWMSPQGGRVGQDGFISILQALT
jgi:hypothetical protein